MLALRSGLKVRVGFRAGVRGRGRDRARVRVRSFPRHQTMEDVGGEEDGSVGEGSEGGSSRGLPFAAIISSLPPSPPPPPPSHSSLHFPLLLPLPPPPYLTPAHFPTY